MVAGAQDGWARAISRLFARLAYVQDWDVSSQGGCRGFRSQVPARHIVLASARNLAFRAHWRSVRSVTASTPRRAPPPYGY